MSILKILYALGSDTKRSHKLALLEQHKTNALFMRVVKLALDPYVNFYIRKIPNYGFRFLAEGEEFKTLDWALDELEKLSSRQLTGHAGIEHLTNVLLSVHPDDATVVERIIGKDLRCGVADGTVNAVVKDFIPEYPCLLARPYDAKNIKNIIFPANSQLKADGVRANAMVAGDAVSHCGRSGREIDLHGSLDHDLKLLASQYGTDMFFDGEFVVVDSKEQIIDRKTGNGIINKAIKGTISPEEAAMVRFQVWDAFPLNEFHTRRSAETYDKRFDHLVKAVQGIVENKEYMTLHSLKYGALKFRLIPYRIVNSLAEAVQHFEELLAAGEEGTILKNFCGIWEDTRSKHLVKFKAELDADMEIIGWNPGEGKFVGQVGSLIVASSDRLVEAAISGFPDDLRAEITRDINSWMNGIVTVLYNERISSKDRAKVDSLFLPRFKERRLDKSVANSSKEIK